MTEETSIKAEFFGCLVELVVVIATFALVFHLSRHVFTDVTDRQALTVLVSLVVLGIASIPRAIREVGGKKE